MEPPPVVEPLFEFEPPEAVDRCATRDPFDPDCVAGSGGGRGGKNFSAKMSLRSEFRMTSFSARASTGAAERSMELIASKRRAKQSCDGAEKYSSRARRRTG